ncbi:MAG TPA: guanylate kinase [Peptococcaceae bacterium]|nr:guanylate kinase [Peptococcaceae bacterium]
MDFDGILLVISGPSGVGKGTLCKALLEEVKDLQISISMTTRKPRQGEIDGKDYFFVSEEEFLERIKRDEFVEWAKVYGHYYGTPWEEVKSALEKGRDLVLEIDTQGAMQIKKKFKDAVFIFILPPSREELQKRIIKRGTESSNSVKKRLESFDEELKYIFEYDYVVVNDSIPDAVEKIKSIYIAERCRPHRIIKRWKG